MNCLGVVSGMRAENLRMWLQEVTREDALDTMNWWKVVSLLQAYF